MPKITDYMHFHARHKLNPIRVKYVRVDNVIARERCMLAKDAADAIAERFVKTTVDPRGGTMLQIDCYVLTERELLKLLAEANRNAK